MKLSSVYVGCAGFSYPHWRKGVFFPKGLRQDQELSEYFSHFNAVEINTTFYGAPTEKNCKSWKRSAPSDVLFSLKMSRRVTHEMALVAVDADLQHFFAGMTPLKGQLGPVLFQLPPHLRKDINRLKNLESILPADGSVKFAFEFRDNSWFSEDVMEVLRKNNWAVVMHSFPQKGVDETTEVTANFVYFRLHGLKEEHAWDYSIEDLRQYAAKIHSYRQRGIECYVYFLNDADGNAPKNAMTLSELLCELSGEKRRESLIHKPKQTTLLDMFKTPAPQQPSSLSSPSTVTPSSADEPAASRSTASHSGSELWMSFSTQPDEDIASTKAHSVLSQLSSQLSQSTPPKPKYEDQESIHKSVQSPVPPNNCSLNQASPESIRSDSGVFPSPSEHRSDGVRPSTSLERKRNRFSEEPDQRPVHRTYTVAAMPISHDDESENAARVGTWIDSKVGSAPNGGSPTKSPQFTSKLTSLAPRDLTVEPSSPSYSGKTLQPKDDDGTILRFFKRRSICKESM